MNEAEQVYRVVWLNAAGEQVVGPTFKRRATVKKRLDGLHGRGYDAWIETAWLQWRRDEL